MRIILSRKGFDSGSGGCPSPIIDGKPISLPIPTSHRSETTYDDLGLGAIVERVTGGKIAGSHLCHHDPMFEDGRWAFGQTGAAQSHLRDQGVACGDLFLFFGLFADENGGGRHHRIFGYMEVEDMAGLGSNPGRDGQPAGFSMPHPHTIGEWNDNNTIYTGPGGLAATADSGLRLTAEDSAKTSVWQVPAWMRRAGLSYHGDADRWSEDGRRLQAVSRGQEFVTNVADAPEALQWLSHIKEVINGNR